jgi:hypothetical protein
MSQGGKSNVSIGQRRMLDPNIVSDVDKKAHALIQ